MKKIVLVSFLIGLSATLWAQGTVNFTAVDPISDNLSPALQSQLKLRVEQILGRNNAAAAFDQNVFIMEPQLVIAKEMKTEGLLQTVSYIKGEFTLLAKNKIDNSLYGSLVIPLSAQNTGTSEKILSHLIQSIRVTDIRYTRFIRTTRMNVADYFSKNCASIIAQGQTLFKLGKYEDALNYLSAVPSNVSCYEQASLLIEKILPLLPKSSSVEESVPAFEEQPIATTAPQTTVPQATITPSAFVQKGILTLSNNRISCEVVSCVGNPTTQSISVELRIINKSEAKQDRLSSKITAAIDNSGKTFTSFSVEGGHIQVFPYNVPVMKTFVVKNIKKEIPSFSFVSMTISNCVVSIRNLSVNWNK